MQTAKHSKMVTITSGIGLLFRFLLAGRFAAVSLFVFQNVKARFDQMAAIKKKKEEEDSLSPGAVSYVSVTRTRYRLHREFLNRIYKYEADSTFHSVYAMYARSMRIL